MMMFMVGPTAARPDSYCLFLRGGGDPVSPVPAVCVPEPGPGQGEGRGRRKRIRWRGEKPNVNCWAAPWSLRAAAGPVRAAPRAPQRGAVPSRARLPLALRRAHWAASSVAQPIGSGVT